MIVSSPNRWGLPVKTPGVSGGLDKQPRTRQFGEFSSENCLRQDWHQMVCSSERQARSRGPSSIIIYETWAVSIPTHPRDKSLVSGEERDSGYQLIPYHGAPT